jgi:hypothetical protein
MNQTLENIILINKQKAYIEDILKKITMGQLTYKIYNLQKAMEFTELDTIYKNSINNMMFSCFNQNGNFIYQGNGFWVLAISENNLVSALMVNFKHDKPWIWNVCRNKSPKFYGYGFGENLIKYTLNYLKINYPTYKQIYLYASQKPISRTKYYESLGFVKVKKYGNDVIDEYGNPVMVFTQVS